VNEEGILNAFIMRWEIKMNSAGMECQLNRGGFTVKEIRALRQYLGESGVTYPVLLGQLRVRFIASVGMLALVAVGFVWTLMYEDFKTAIAATISLAIIFPVFLCRYTAKARF
jgi:hypothetical protein